MDASAGNTLSRFRAELTGFQKELLGEIWTHYVAHNEWPRARLMHSKHEKFRVRAAFEALGGSVVFELADHSQGNRYGLSAIGALLVGGEEALQLLVRYFAFARKLFYQDPDKFRISDTEIVAELGIDAQTCLTLGKILSLAPFYDGTIAGSGWTVRMPPAVEDFPKSGSIDGKVVALVFSSYSTIEPVFLDQRKVALPSLSGGPFLEAPQPAESPVAVDALKRRYQVFVSSTYEDLKEERQRVMQALLETKCIPTGMELFPAASTEQWELIKRVIDECDYYVVIVAGRYGSLGPLGTSYTEQEFDYAVSRGRPVIGFYHQDVRSLVGAKLEDSDDGRKRMDAFTKKVKTRLCRPWRTADELSSAVKSAILNELEFNAQPGWIRADKIPSIEGVEKLRQRIADLEESLKEAKRRVPQIPQSAAVQISLAVTYDVEGVVRPGGKSRTMKKTKPFVLEKSWDQILLTLEALFRRRTNIDELKSGFEASLLKELSHELDAEHVDDWSRECHVAPELFERIIQTFVARRLMRLDSARSRFGSSSRDVRLTPAGITRLAELRAL